MLKDYRDVMTVKQLAEALGIGVNKAYEIVNQDEIGSVRVGRRILVPKKCVIDYLNAPRYNIHRNGGRVQLSKGAK